MTALAEAAQRAVDRHEARVLSERDRHAFFDALMRPPRPSTRLRRAFRAYGKRVVS
jgi:uncharacterized protein (DUF1778 family)